MFRASWPSRLRRSEQTSPDSTGVAAVEATGVVTVEVTAEEEGTSLTVRAGGAFCHNCSTQFTGLTAYITGDAVGDSKLQPIKVPPHVRRNASPLLALYICHTMYLPSHPAIHYWTTN